MTGRPRRMRRWVFTPILVVFVVGCASDKSTHSGSSTTSQVSSVSTSSSTTRPFEQLDPSEQLSRARAKWAAVGPPDYTIKVGIWDMRGGFSCTFGVVRGMATLHGDPVAASVGWNGSMTVPKAECRTLPSTVEEVFDRVSLMLRAGGMPIVVKYDERGVPMDITPGQGVIDGGGFTVEVTAHA